MNPRQRLALDLHQAGKTYKEVGDLLGVSRERARQIVAVAKRGKLSPPASDWRTKLTATQDQALVLRRQGLTYKEIAENLGERNGGRAYILVQAAMRRAKNPRAP